MLAITGVCAAFAPKPKQRNGQRDEPKEAVDESEPEGHREPIIPVDLALVLIAREKGTAAAYKILV